MRIHDALKEAQDGRAHANLARAFHLPPEKVDVAVATAVSELIALLGARMQTRSTLAALVDLIGQGAYEQVLDTPVLLGATHTQVLGADALKVIAGRSGSERLAHQAAATAEVSDMISEYLLPVIAAMLVGALARMSRPALDAIAAGDPDGAADVLSSDNETRRTLHLPRASAGVGFSGSTGGSVGFVAPVSEPSRYLELAEAIENPKLAADGADPADAVRNCLAAYLADSAGHPHQPPGKWMLDTLTGLFSNRRR